MEGKERISRLPHFRMPKEWIFSSLPSFPTERDKFSLHQCKKSLRIMHQTVKQNKWFNRLKGPFLLWISKVHEGTKTLPLRRKEKIEKRKEQQQQKKSNRKKIIHFLLFSFPPHKASVLSSEKFTSLLEIAKIGLQLVKMPRICTLLCDLKQKWHEHWQIWQGNLCKKQLLFG